MSKETAVLNESHVVTMRNILNEVHRNNMTLQEMRFFSIYLSKINPDDTSTRVVRFPLSDFQKIMEFGRLNISQLKTTTDSLLGKIVRIPTEHGGYRSFQIFKECLVDQDEFGRWFVEIDAHDKALPLMFDFKAEYFSYELWNALRLKSPNQLKMYQFLKQYQKFGERKISIIDLRDRLGIDPTQYPRWDNFKRRVLDSCQQALAECTDIVFDYEPIKIGNKTTGVHFFIRKNPRHVDQLSLDEFIELQPNPGIEDPDQITFDYESDDSSRLDMRIDFFRTALKDDGKGLTDSQIDELQLAAHQSEFGQSLLFTGSLYVRDQALHAYIMAQDRYSRSRSSAEGFFGYLLKAVKNNYAQYGG